MSKALNFCWCFLVVLVSLEAHSQSLVIESGWIRLLPSTLKNTSAYMEITNSGDKAIEISRAQSLIAERTEIHRSDYKNGLISMQHMKSLSIPPQSSISMTSGGMHIMLIGLKSSLEHGQLHEVCLISTVGDRICDNLEVLHPSSKSSLKIHDH